MDVLLTFRTTLVQTHMISNNKPAPDLPKLGMS